MDQEKKKSFLGRFFASRLFLMFAIITIGFIGFGYARAYYQDYCLKQEIRQLRDEVSNLEAKKIQSMEILQYVMSPAFAEETARTELNLKKPGENVVILKNHSFAKINSETDDLKTDTLSNISKWWNYFFIHE